MRSPSWHNIDRCDRKLYPLALALTFMLLKKEHPKLLGMLGKICSSLQKEKEKIALCVRKPLLNNLFQRSRKELSMCGSILSFER